MDCKCILCKRPLNMRSLHSSDLWYGIPYVNYKQRYKPEDNHLVTRNSYEQHSNWTRHSEMACFLKLVRNRQMEGGEEGPSFNFRGYLIIQWHEHWNLRETNRLDGDNELTMQTHTYVQKHHRETNTVLSLHALGAMCACLKQRLAIQTHI